MYTVFTLYYILIPTTWNVTWFPIENYIGLFLQCISTLCHFHVQDSTPLFLHVIIKKLILNNLDNK
jgi:hypothetical protein